MKRRFLLTCLLLPCLTAFSQTEKSRYTLGTGFLFVNFIDDKQETIFPASNSTEKRETNYLSIDLTPQFGKFVMDDLLIGGRIQTTFSRSKEGFEGSNISSTGTSNQAYYSIGPFIKYFFGNGEKGKPFIDFSSRVGIRISKFKMEYSDDASYENDSRERFVNGSVGAGYALFLDDSILLSFFLAYTHERIR